LLLQRPQKAFEMGASRREAGRRANENLRQVQLTRAFYLGDKEVSNAQFRQFQPAHRSGAALGAVLDGDDQPVVNVSWEDAARYCNWLSKQQGLPEAYEEKGGKLQLKRPVNTGYRLPSEAEWAYVARFKDASSARKYGWQGAFPPQQPVGNFADAQIADSLADVTPGGYDDGFRVSAPVGRFAQQPNGFYDLGGNVAEWTGDYYAVYPGVLGKISKDPLGPDSGRHRVIKGASWRHGDISALRLSYRDYGRKPRDDLGFRIARYAQGGDR
jgi:formylglycine-generating enzyme required for sulfatase activity